MDLGVLINLLKLRKFLHLNAFYLIKNHKLLINRHKKLFTCRLIEQLGN